MEARKRRRARPFRKAAAALPGVRGEAGRTLSLSANVSSEGSEKQRRWLNKDRHQVRCAVERWADGTTWGPCGRKPDRSPGPLASRSGARGDSSWEQASSAPPTTRHSVFVGVGPRGLVCHVGTLAIGSNLDAEIPRDCKVPRDPCVCVPVHETSRNDTGAPTMRLA